MDIQAKHNNKKSSSTGHWATPGPSRSGCYLVMFCLDSRRGREQSNTEDSSLEGWGSTWGSPLSNHVLPDPGSHGDFALCTHKEVAGDPPVTVPWASRWLSGKESDCSAGNPGSVSSSRRSPGEGIGNPLQYSCLENPMYRGAWRATAHGVVKTRIWLSDLTITTLRCLYISDAAFNGFVVMSIYVSVNSNRKWVHPRPRSWLCLPHLSSVCMAQWPAPSGHSVHFSWVNQQMTHPMKVPTWQSSGIEPCEPRRAYSRWWSSRRDQFLSLHQLFSSQR